MIKVKDIDNRVVPVPSYETFKAWVTRVMIAYVILGIGVTLGMWALTNHSNNDVISKINNFAEASCLVQNNKDSTVNKYNDLVDDLIQSRIRVRDNDIAKNDSNAIKLDNAAIARYQADKIIPPTPEQCKVPILR